MNDSLHLKMQFLLRDTSSFLSYGMPIIHFCFFALFNDLLNNDVN